MKRNLLLFLVGALAVPLSASAGSRNSTQVTVASIVVGTYIVYGSLKGTAESPDTMQYIQVRHSGAGYSYVMIRDATGRSFMCSTNDPLKMQALGTLNPASYLSVYIPESGTCGQIDVTTGSMWMP